MIRASIALCGIALAAYAAGWGAAAVALPPLVRLSGHYGSHAGRRAR